MRFTGSINKHSPVTEVLRFLEMTTGIRFKVEGKQIVVSKFKRDKRSRLSSPIIDNVCKPILEPD